MSNAEMSKFSVSEMVQDRAESLADIKVCERALLLGITEYSGGSVKRRLEVNRNIVALIEAELFRRGKEEFA